MRLVDTHAHLDFPTFEQDRVELIQELAQQEIGVVNISTSVESVSGVVKLAHENELIWAMIGVHPTDITPAVLTDLPRILEEWSGLLETEPKIVGVGEIGLDYYHDRSTTAAENQKAALRQFLTFAQEKNQPVSFHCREAYGDLLTILADYPEIQGVIHCFSGNQAQADSFLKLGLHLSFTAIITYPQNQSLRDIAAKIPLEKMMLETDCPFLPPQEKRGERNDPRTVEEIAQLIAELRGSTKEEIATATTDNAKRFFTI